MAFVAPFLLSFLLVFSTSASAAKECEDGVHNVIHLKDELKGESVLPRLINE